MRLECQKREEETGQQLTDVVIRLTEALDETGVHGLEQELCARTGVVSATHRPGRNHLMVVVFDRDAIRPASLLIPSALEKGRWTPRRAAG